MQGAGQSCDQSCPLTLGFVALSNDFTSLCLSFLICTWDMWVVCTQSCYEVVVGNLQDNPNDPYLLVFMLLYGDPQAVMGLVSETTRLWVCHSQG